MRILKYALTTVLLVAICFAAQPVMAQGAKGVVNINTADAEALALLPRVGPAVARKIIDFREKNGRFKSIEDLLLVRGVGEKTFDLMKPHLAVAGETTLVEKVPVPRPSAVKKKG